MTANQIHSLERTVTICATLETVFRFFTDSNRFAKWWGEGSKIDGRKGGRFEIHHPGGVRSSGEILEIDPPHRIVFSYGYDSGKPFGPGESKVTITLQTHPEGTLLRLFHELSDATARDEHVQGWRFQLALFSNAAANDQHSDIEKRVDAYFDLWNRRDADDRLQRMKGTLTGDIRFRDQYSCTQGWEDLNDHLSAYQHFMPGMTLSRDGRAQHCQGRILCRWLATKEDGSTVAKGSNTFLLTPQGEIREITGFWD